MPNISVDDMIVGEGDGFVDVVVRLDVASASQITVSYAALADTATNGTSLSSGDFQAVNGTLTFAAGETEKVVRILLTNTTPAEGFETFVFRLTSPTNATISDSYAQIGIVDNDTVVSTPGIVVRDVVVDEKAGTATFVVMLGGPGGQASGSEVTVDYSTADGTAVAGSDYTASSGTLVFAPGETVKTVTIDITNDITAENFERLFLNLSNPTGATILDGQAAAVIGASDSTAVAQPRVSVSDMTVGEGDGFVDIVVSLSAPGQNVVTVAYSYANDTANNGTDYQGLFGTLTFAPGETTKVVRFQIGNDQVAEGFESFVFTLASPTNATIAKSYAQIGIVDNDTVVGTPGLFVRDVTVDEKAGTATFVVTLGGPAGQASNSVVTVDYATDNGTASAGSDFTASSGTLTFAAGETVKTITVDITDDTAVEGFERFLLNLSNANGATILDGQAAAGIGANDSTAVAQPRVSVSDMIVGEGDGFVDIVVSLSAPGQNVVTVNFSYSNDTAANGTDYQGLFSTLTFAPGETTKVVRFQIGNDQVAEGLESFVFTLASPTNATIAKSYAQIGIVDNDTVVDTPSLFVRDVAVDEKAGTATFYVTLGGPTGQASNSVVTVDYATGNGTASAGSDFTAGSGTLTFAVGETVKAITIDISDDAAIEGLERFFLNLSNASGATILDGQAAGTIGANDSTAVSQPRISVSDMTVGESDGFVDVVVSLSAPGQNNITVNFSYSNGSAANGTDYSGLFSTLTFAAGETTKVLRFEIEDDQVAEGFESFYITLASPTNATISKAYSQISIVDDDTVVDTPNLFVRDVSVDEKAGTATFYVMLGGPDGQSANNTITVDYATGNGTADAGSDFSAVSGTLTFAPGETVKAVTVDITDDATLEGAERFLLNLSGANGATILDGQGVAVIGANDAPAVAQPRISVSDLTVSESEGYVDIVVSLSAPGQNAVSVNYSYSNSTAANGTDYAGDFSTLVFAPGETTKVIRFEIEDDLVAEGFETFFFTLASPTNATISKSFSRIGIVDDDSVVDTPTLVVRDAVVDEKAGTATFVVMLGGPAGQSSNGTITVDYATADGTAVDTGDYSGVAGTLTFASGETVKTITVDIADDATAEALERVNLNLSNAVGATIVDGSGVAEIGANDALAIAQPHVTVDDVTVAEGDGYVDFALRLTAPGQTAVSVNFTYSNGSAANGTDYQGVFGTVTFAPGETLRTVRFEIENDGVVEALEGFSFILSSAVGAVIDKPTTTVTIVDDDTIDYQVFSHGRSDDVYTVDQTADQVIENLGGGDDTVFSSATYTLAANVDQLVLTGGENLNGTGNALANRITGNSGANVLAGLAGNDTLDGGAGNDTMNGSTGNDLFIVDSGSDIVVEGVGAGTDTVHSTATYTLAVNLENLLLLGDADIDGTGNDLANRITGNTGNNQLSGGAGNDTLEGEDGADTMIGGLGNDRYLVDDGGDVVTEALGGGIDTVETEFTTTLGIEIENLLLTGTAAINGTGNASNNAITGNGEANVLNGGLGNDTLDGGAGADTLVGGLGNDSFRVDNALDVVTELALGGLDTLVSTLNQTLSSEIENLTLIGTAALNGTGNAGNNLITGNTGANKLGGLGGNDTLNGGQGADTLTGGTGNDVYFLDDIGDVVVELNAGGIDTVNSSSTRVLANFAENLVLTGTLGIGGTGNTLANRITGNAGANRLDGGTGIDTLVGGAGNDTYIVNVVGETVSEALNAGIDTVFSAASWTLGLNLENLTLTGSAALAGNGNAVANVIAGNAGSNTLRGFAGNDTFVLNSRTGIDTLADFSAVVDTVRVSQATLRIGDGDLLVEGAATRPAAGGFTTAAELVVFTSNIVGAINAASAAVKIGSATGNYAAGATRLFVVDNGVQTGVFLFTSSGVNAAVSAAELLQLAVVNAPATTVTDFLWTT